MVWDNQNLVNVLKGGGVAVMPTDTIYGIVGSALDPSAVERIYQIRERSPNKPCIVLIGDISELVKFSVILSEEQRKVLNECWPAYASASAGKNEPISIVLNCFDDSLLYLHRGTRTLAFRVPMSEDLRNLLLKTGPLIAPSANTEAVPPLSPAQNVKEAKKYFGNSVSLYIDGGQIAGKASKLIKLNQDGSVVVLRQ